MSNTVKTSTNKLNPPLRGWQQDIIEQVDLYEEMKDSEQYQGLPDFTVNKSLSVTVAMPRGAGHTFLANYIASKYPALLLYGKQDHYKKVTERFPLHPSTETISIYELFFAMYKPGTHQPSEELVEIRKKFENKKVVVLDNALSIPEGIKDFVFDSARGVVILLGH